MQPSHDRADDLRNGGRRFGLRLRICAAQSDETMATFQLFRFRQADAELFGDHLGNGMTGRRNITSEETVAFGEEEVCRTAADVDDDDAFVRAKAIGAGRIEAGGGSDINQNRIQTDLHDGVRELFDNVVLDDD